MNAEETIAGYLAQEAGYRVDPERLADSVAANRSRQRIDRQELFARLEEVALRAKRAASRVELEHWAWRRQEGPETLAALQAAQAARTAAREELMEACHYDEQLFADVVARYR